MPTPNDKKLDARVKKLACIQSRLLIKVVILSKNTKIISKKDTPLTVKEIKSSNLKKQIKLKQKIKGSGNLSKFISK